MKKLLSGFGLLIVVNISVFSQEVDRRFTIQTSPFLYVFDLISLGTRDGNGSLFIMDLEGQYKINDNMNVSLTLSFLINNSTIYGYIYYPATDSYNYSYVQNVFQINLKPMFVYRPFGTGLKGFYVGIYPNIGWQSMRSSNHKNVEFETDNGFWTEIGIGINTGYKWVFSGGFTLQLGTGIGKTWSIPEKPENTSIFINSDGRMTLRNFDIHILDLKLGYSF